MKVQNANRPSIDATGQPGRNQDPRGASSSSSDDVHLSELVKTLRSLAPDSPERQERIEQIARAYADGTYNVDTETTAAKIIDESLQYP